MALLAASMNLLCLITSLCLFPFLPPGKAEFFLSIFASNACWAAGLLFSSVGIVSDLL
jgi:hypothetical protein